MPELPEVETLARQIRPFVEGETILDAEVAVHPRFREARSAVGSKVVGLMRRGKYLILELDGGAELVLHLGMTGQLLWGNRPDKDHVHLGLVFPSGVLWFRDPRRFGRVSYLPSGDRSGLLTLSSLGPEPDDPEFTVARVRRFLCPSGSPVKARLLEQRLVAGVGNYIADEVLWRARVHPEARSIDTNAARRVHRAVLSVVSDSLRFGGVSERDYLHLDGSAGSFAEHLDAHGRAGLPCRRCKTLLLKSRVAGRGTVHCPSCQQR